MTGTVKNTSDVDIEVNADVTFLDASGNDLDDGSAVIENIVPGDQKSMIIDSKYAAADAHVNVMASEASYVGVSDSLSAVMEWKDDGNAQATITNDSEQAVDKIAVIICLYKGTDEELVDATELYYDEEVPAGDGILVETNMDEDTIADYEYDNATIYVYGYAKK